MLIACVWGRGETGKMMVQNGSPAQSHFQSVYAYSLGLGREETGKMRIQNRSPKITLRASMLIACVWGRGEIGKMMVQNGSPAQNHFQSVYV